MQDDYQAQRDMLPVKAETVGHYAGVQSVDRNNTGRHRHMPFPRGADQGRCQARSKIWRQYRFENNRPTSSGDLMCC